MMNTLTSLLTPYGFFKSHLHGDLRFAEGSIVAGVETHITTDGELITVETSEWFWDGADVEWTRDTKVTCHLSQIWEHIPKQAYRTRR